MHADALIELVAKIIEVVGVAAIAFGLVASSIRFVRARWRRRDGAYSRYRRAMGRTLLLGLELLVAADIVASVAAELTFESIGVLGILVVVRTFLAWSLEVEIEGRWPWQAVPSGARHDTSAGPLESATRDATPHSASG